MSASKGFDVRIGENFGEDSFLVGAIDTPPAVAYILGPGSNARVFSTD